MPKVSIIIPIYNVEKYLFQCLKSVAEQTLKDIEIICVNDGSTDGCDNIIEQFVQVDSRFQVVNKSNSGYGDSMNRGLEIATGDYIGIVESDDFVSKDCFEKLYNEATSKDVDIVKANYYEYYENLEPVKQTYLDDIGYNKVFVPLDRMAKLNSMIFHWSAIYRRSVIEENAIRFSVTPGASFQDVSFAYLCYLHAKSMVCISDAFLFYRCDNSTSSVKSKEKAFAIFGEFERITTEYEKCNAKSELVQLEEVKLRHYLGHYNRIHALFKYAFLMKMHDEILVDEEKRYLDYEILHDPLKSDIWEIENDFESFYRRHCNEYINEFALENLCMNSKIKDCAIKAYLKNSDSIYVFGAGKYAEKLIPQIIEICNVRGILVSNKKDNEITSIHGISLIEINDVSDRNSMVFVALQKKSQPAVVRQLINCGFKNIVVCEGISL